MPITKRPCANCPFRRDGAAIELKPGRVEGVINGLLADDFSTFVCHKTLDSERMTCAGAVAVMAKLERLPVIARLGLHVGVLSEDDIAESMALVLDPSTMNINATKHTGTRKR